MTVKVVPRSVCPNTRRALIFASLFAGGDSKHHNRLASVAVELQLTPHQSRAGFCRMWLYATTKGGTTNAAGLK
jgi:hypothetical protein